MRVVNLNRKVKPSRSSQAAKSRFHFGARPSMELKYMTLDKTVAQAVCSWVRACWMSTFPVTNAIFYPRQFFNIGKSDKVMQEDYEDDFRALPHWGLRSSRAAWWSRLSWSSRWETLLSSFSTTWAATRWSCLKLERDGRKTLQLGSRICLNGWWRTSWRNIPLQKQAEIIPCQLAAVISLSAQLLHLSAEGLQAQSQPMDARTVLGWNGRTLIVRRICLGKPRPQCRSLSSARLSHVVLLAGPASNETAH